MLSATLPLLGGLCASQLVMMPQKAQTDGAVCLDGSDSGFYFEAAANVENAHHWQIYFQGGGWCYDEVDCVQRSTSNLGSSKVWGPSLSAGGVMDTNCSINPDFCNYNKVLIPYCDGNSFSGDGPDVVVGNVTLHFRGKRILNAVLETLVESFNLSKAEKVLLTGCSAGGLATYLHADYVHQWVGAKAPGLKVFKAASISGFFLNHRNYTGYPVYAEQMQHVWSMQAPAKGVNDACVASLPPQMQWRCNFANETYAHINTPFFVLNSALDAWQTSCIFTSSIPPNFPHQTGDENGVCDQGQLAMCSYNPDYCTGKQMASMNQYMTAFNHELTTIPTYNKAGNGAFVHSCHTHCEAQNNPSYSTFAINGVTMQQAVSKWWNSNNEPASMHQYTPCLYNTSDYTSKRDCNPTCIGK